MANVTFLWDGKTETPGEVTSNFYQGTSSGYFRPLSSSTDWTGINLTYDRSSDILPKGGILTSLKNVQNSGVWSMTITGISIVIPANFTLETLFLEMTKGKDDWYGDESNNVFIFNGGGDTFHGGGGLDTLNMYVNKGVWISAASKLTKLINGNIQVTNSGTTSFILDSIERLTFTDVSIAFDLNGNAGKVAKILGAVFGASFLTNKNYVGIGLNLLDSGMETKKLLDLALTTKLGPNYTSEAEIKLLYLNVFNLTPSASTLDVLKGLIDNGYCTRPDLAYIISETANNQTNINLTGLTQTGIEYIPQ